MVSPLTPVDGSELLLVNQDGRTVAVNRTQANLILALAGIRSAPGTSKLTERTGTEQFRALQGGMQVNMSLSDLTAYLAATGPVGFVPRHLRADLFNGTERFIVQQGVSLAAADIMQTAYIRGSGGSLGGLGGDFPGNSGGGVVTPPVPVVNFKLITGSDSITIGLKAPSYVGRTAAVDANGFATGFTLPTGSNLTISNVAISGLKVSGDNGSGGAAAYNGFPTQIGAALDASKTNIISILGGTNDGPFSNARAVYKALRDIMRRVSYRSSQNGNYPFRLIAMTLTSRSTSAGADTTFDGNTLPVNDWIRKFYNSDMGYDALVDLAAITGLDTAANFIPPLTSDALHPDAPGYDLFITPYRNAVNAVIAGPGTKVRGPLGWNPVDTKAGKATFSNANRSGTFAANVCNVKAVQFIAKGEKRFYELDGNCGQLLCSEPFENELDDKYGNSSANALQYTLDGNMVYNQANVGTAPAAGSGVTVAQWAIDRVLEQYWVRPVGGNWNGSATADPATGVGGRAIPTAMLAVTEFATGRLYPAATLYAAGQACTTRFAASEMTSGFTVNGFLRMDQ
jgi:lysophospholipase L1-like esterase